MFGYVQPLKPELKLKEYEAYKGYYCGLCKAIKENYTHTARFMLNYDCATLALLLSSMSDEVPSVVKERCVVSPVKKKTVVRAREASYAAAVNVLLGCAKIDDNVRDEGGLAARILRLIYRPLSFRARAENEALAAEFAQKLNNLTELEKERSADLDAVADAFAQLLAVVFSQAPYEFTQKPSAKKALWHFGYNLGRWIYIADAVNDIEKDAKNKSYNVFLVRAQGKDNVRQAVLEEAKFNMHMSLSQACNAYELLDIKRDKPLLDNIMYLGLAKKTEDVLKGKADGSV